MTQWTVETLVQDDFRRFLEQVDWARLEKLRAPTSLSKALHHLGLKEIVVIRKEMRQTAERVWITVPTWLKEESAFVKSVRANEIGHEIFKAFNEELLEECYRLQESIIRTDKLGLSTIMVPLVLQGEKIGFLRMGGFVLDTGAEADTVLTERLKILMWEGAELQKAIGEWRQLPRFTTDKRAIVVQMLELVAKEIVEFLNETLSAKEREDSIHKQTFNQIVTSHPPLRGLLKKLPQMAQADSPVLIVGEPGTGRELLCSILHDLSPRKSKVLKSIHCSAVAENLLEAEFFGYEKGAMLGAYSAKPGLFEICQGGTLYLSEIADLSLSLQHKILRVFQEKSFHRLGGQQALPFDVRIVASTQRNLRRLVQMGAFREELFFCLNVIDIEIPPLRQRKEDIPLLAEYFLQEFLKQMSKEGIQWREEALLKLSAHSFPGNIRELRNEVERLVAVKDSHSLIEVKDLSVKIVEALSPIDEIEKGVTLKAIVDDYERKIVGEALTKYHWNKSRVAELFQITRQGLLKKISKYKLDKRKKF